jgi:hypothetical protein
MFSDKGLGKALPDRASVTMLPRGRDMYRCPGFEPTGDDARCHVTRALYRHD